MPTWLQDKNTHLNSDKPIKIFEINECDWMIGDSLEGCVKDYANYYDPDDVAEARELSEYELGKLVYIDDDDKKRSFAEQLKIEIAKGGSFPRLFASTEV